MSSRAPETRPMTATTTKGTRNQVGRMVARAPIGSLAIAPLRSGSDPARSSPKRKSTMLVTESPVAVQPATPVLDDVRGR